MSSSKACDALLCHCIVTRAIWQHELPISNTIVVEVMNTNGLPIFNNWGPSPLFLFSHKVVVVGATTITPKIRTISYKKRGINVAT
jgi:hypothetical protein